MNCQVMGIVNVTPDSFSDGGRFFSSEEAIRRAHNVVAEGAAAVDIGGESTRPGATPIGWKEEWRRIEPVLSALVGGVGDCALSVDTYHVETARRALDCGATVVNCVYPEPIPDMLRLCAERGASLVMPVAALDTADSGLLAKVPHWIDPMIGFGTTREKDVSLLRGVAELSRRGRVLVGASRKRVVKRLVGEKTPGKDIGGNLAIAAWCALEGASMVRVHDVRETVQTMRVLGVLAVGPSASPSNVV